MPAACGLLSLRWGVDLKTPAGRIVYSVLAQIAEFRARADQGARDCRHSGGQEVGRSPARCARINGPKPSGCTSRTARASARPLRCSAASDGSCIGLSMAPSGPSGCVWCSRLGIGSGGGCGAGD